MNQPCRPPLKTNPFTTYRDPETGQWQVIPADAFNIGSDRLTHSVAASRTAEPSSPSKSAIALDSP